MSKKNNKTKDPRLEEQAKIMATFVFGEVVAAIVGKGHEAVILDRNNGKFVSFRTTPEGIECSTGTSSISEVDLEAMSKEFEKK